MAGATEIRSFTVTCPPGTLQSAPQVTNIPMPPRVVENIRIRVPKGPNGIMGFSIGAAGVGFLPFGASTFIVASDEVINWAVNGEISSGAWQAFMYNTGKYPHSILLQFTVHVPDVDNPGIDPAIITAISSLSAPPSAGSGAGGSLPAPPNLEA